MERQANWMLSPIFSMTFDFGFLIIIVLDINTIYDIYIFCLFENKNTGDNYKDFLQVN